MRNKKEKNSYFKYRLLYAMSKKEITQAQLADKIGVTHQAMSQYVLGKSEPCLTTLVLIAQHLNVTTDFLLGNAVKVKIRLPVGKTGKRQKNGTPLL